MIPLPPNGGHGLVGYAQVVARLNRRAGRSCGAARLEGALVSEVRITAVLGAGALGGAMAARLGETDQKVRLWNRTAERARVAAAQARGVTAVDGLTEAVSGASVVITVLRDGAAVAEVMADAIAGVDEGAVWIQASTVGPRSARVLSDLARDHGVVF